MQNKKIIAWASAGAIIIAGVGTAAGVTAHNLNVARAEAERESMSAITDFLTSQPAPASQPNTKDTTAAPATVPQTTAGDSGSKATTAPTTEVQTTKITWAYDADLSNQVGKLLEQLPRFSNSPFDPNMKRDFHPENCISWYDNTIGEQNNRLGYVGPVNSIHVSQSLVDLWTEAAPPQKGEKFGITVYKYSTGWYYVAIFY